MLEPKVRRAIHRHRMIHPGDGVLIAISGGPDSVALTESLVELRAELGISLALAHLNHGLREEAEEDQDFCRRIALRHDLPFATERVDAAASAKESRRSIEDAARRLRYRFLDSAAERFGCSRIAVGHTLDDQAETLLLRLFRGSGRRGLGAVYPVVEGRIIRPLLDLRRSEIVAYLEERGVSYREDATNADPRFARNRIRHEDLPRLASAYNPRLAETLARSAALLRDEEIWMEGEAAEAYHRLASESEEGVRLPLAALAERPTALRRRLVRLAIQRARGSLTDVGRIHVEDVLDLVETGQSGLELHLPGVVAMRSFGEVVFQAAELRRKRADRGYNGFEYRLTIPARVRIPEGGGTLLARFSSPAGKPDSTGRTADGVVPPPPSGNAVIVGFEGRLPELKVRSPRPGDRFHPLGAPGSKPLTRYLMERKVARDERSSVPLVVRRGEPGIHAGRAAKSDGCDPEEILWVVGHGVAEAGRVSSGCRRLQLEWVVP